MKKTFAIVLSMVMLLSLCACGAKSTTMQASGETVNGTVYLEEADGLYSMAGADDTGLAAMSRAASESVRNAKGGTEGDTPQENPEKIIYSSDVTVESTDFETALQRVDELVARFEGWIEASSVSGSNYYDVSRGRAGTRNASFTLRIPSERFHELMGSLSELGNVPYTHIYTENVTAQYYDVQARLTACQTQEARLLEMMEKAETVEDIITIESRLSELRYQIESLQSSLRGWDRRVSYSSVYLQLNEVREYTPDTPVHISFGEKLSRAFQSGFRSLGEFFRDALLWLVEALPSLAVLALGLSAVIVIARGAHGRRKKKKAAMAAERRA